MFLVTPDHTYGLVAAPRATIDRTPETDALLTAAGFAWNDAIGAYTRSTGTGPNDVDHAADKLRALGHDVFHAYTAPATG
ncbi:hypothetical protein [Streptomyces sp. NPDC050145]|uniref:hypothetical protein n=1 Tax=Streptomyces sp. NPDC050145 TaxID=3365602 RepID=UPI0037AD98B0